MGLTMAPVLPFAFAFASSSSTSSLVHLPLTRQRLGPGRPGHTTKVKVRMRMPPCSGTLRGSGVPKHKTYYLRNDKKKGGAGMKMMARGTTRQAKQTEREEDDATLSPSSSSSWSLPRSGVKLSGVPLDCTEDKLRFELDRLLGGEGEGLADAVTQVAVDKNLLGLCESGVAFVSTDKWEDTNQVCKLINEKQPHFIDKNVSAQAMNKDDLDSDPILASLGGKTSRTSALLNRLSLEQHKKDLEGLEEEFKQFENTSY